MKYIPLVTSYTHTVTEVVYPVLKWYHPPQVSLPDPGAPTKLYKNGV